MSIISRYILRNITTPFIFGSGTIIFLFLFQFIMKYLDQLLGKGLSEWVVIQLIVLNIAWMSVLALPMGLLFATLMTFGSMSAANEITIIKTSGAGLFKMMTPVMIFATILTVFMFWFNDAILPDANHRAKTLMHDIQRKKPTFSIEAGQFSTELEGFAVLARQVDSLSGSLKAVTIYDNTKGSQLNIVSADSGVVEFNSDFTKLIFRLFRGEIHQVTQANVNNYRKVDFKEYQIAMNANGFNFERSAEGAVSKGDRELHISDMEVFVEEANNNIERTRNSIKSQIDNHLLYLLGEDSLQSSRNITQNVDTAPKSLVSQVEKQITVLRSGISSQMHQINDHELRAKSYKVEINKKYSLPFACFLFAMIGCPLGIMTRRGNFGISAAICVGFYIFYWAGLIGGEKLADRGLMSPFMSMWLGNFVIAIIGIVLIIKVNNESVNIGKFFWKLFPKK